MKNLGLFLMCFITFLAFSASSISFGRNCVKGKACGDTCIPMTSTCHLGEKNIKTPNGAPTLVQQAKQDLKSDLNLKSNSKVCKTGKPCGKTCISVKAICRADGSFDLAKRHK